MLPRLLSVAFCCADHRIHALTIDAETGGEGSDGHAGVDGRRNGGVAAAGRVSQGLLKAQCLWERIEEVYPDLVGEDGVVEPTPGRQTAGSGAAQWVLGDVSVSEAIAAYQAALRKAEEAKDCMVGTLIAAEQSGARIAVLADKAGVTRQTIYRWIGR